MVERGGKRKWGRCSLKRMFWVGLSGVLGRGLTSLRLAPALVFCPLCLLAVPPQDKKAGAAHGMDCEAMDTIMWFTW